MKIDHLSYSQINSYMQCPLRWKFRKDGIEPDKVSVCLVYGKSIHAALEALYKNKLNGKKSNVDDLMQKYDEVFESEKIEIDYGKKNTKEELRNIAEKSIEQYLEFIAEEEDEGEILLIEQGIKYKVARDIPDIVSYIDLVLIKNNKVHIVDFKTAKSIPGPSNVNSEQLILYAIALKRAGLFDSMGMGFELEYIYITKTKNPKIKRIQVKADKNKALRLIEKIKSVFRAMRSGIVYPNEGWYCSSGCGYRSHCVKDGV